MCYLIYHTTECKKCGEKTYFSYPDPNEEKTTRITDVAGQSVVGTCC